MEKAFAKAEELVFTVKEYVDTRLEIVKIEAAEKISGIMATLLAVLIVGIVFLFFIGFASIGLAIVLSEWIGKAWAGFLIVSFIYLLIGILVWITRKRIIQLPVMNALIHQMFKNDDQD